MTSERPTVRPVTLARLAEVTHACEQDPCSTQQIEDELDVTHRRARETILEAQRIGYLTESDPDSDISQYQATATGCRFLQEIRTEAWVEVSELLEANSPHYQLFLQALEEVAPASLEEILTRLQEVGSQPYTFNETSIEILGDWAERLGVSQRNAFTGDYYPVQRFDLPSEFPSIVLSVFDRLEQTAGINLRQRYLAVPELREHTCEELFLPRPVFDTGLLDLVNQNVGKIELSGAPIDSGAKEAKLGIKQIEAASGDGLVSTSQSTEQVMSGVEQFGKQYYYLAVYDRDLKFNQNHE